MKNEAEILSTDIKLFLEVYANISPNYDPMYPDDDKYTGPDPCLLLNVANCIDNNIVPDYPWSSWESGCYKNYSDKKGREQHNTLLKRIKVYIETLKK